MSKRVKYVESGFEGVANDKAAAILEKKGVVKILGDAEAPAPKAKTEEKKA